MTEPLGNYVNFSLLAQIWMDHQNMSEHVLCMVLYLVELGLDNHAQEDKEDEVSGSSAVVGNL